MLIAALFLSAALVSQEEHPKDLPIDPFSEDSGDGFNVGLRAGGWRLGSFDALTPSGRRKVNQSLLFDAGLDVRGELDPVTLTLSGDTAVARNLRMTLGSILVGVKIPLDESTSPLELHLAAGPAFGRLDVDLPGFGEFKTAVGFDARLRTLAWLDERIGIEFWFDYRQIRFLFEPPVIAGNTHTQSATIAFGAGLILRF